MIGLQPQGRAAMGTIPLRPELVELTGDYRYALLLQQLCYETSRTPDGWVQMTSAQLAAPFGSVSTRTIERWIDHMEEAGWIEVRRELTTAGRVNRYRPQRENYTVIDAAIERSHGPSTFVEAGERKPDDKLSKARRQNVEPDDKLSSPANDKMSSALIRELESTHTNARARLESVEQVIVRVERETSGGGFGLQLTDEQATKLLEHSDGDVDTAVESFIDVQSRYQNAPIYQVIGWVKERVERRRSAAGRMAAQAQSGRSTRMTLNSHEGDDTIPFGISEGGHD